MPYNTFTLSQVAQEFDLMIAETPGLFANTPPLEPSPLLVTLLNRGVPLATSIATEKARSEFIIAPVLLEIKERFSDKISLFSGTTFNVLPERGLSGVCDFMLSRSPQQQLFVDAPVVCVVEAKDDKISSGLGQCVAEMLAAQIFNERRRVGGLTVYGTVTTGDRWKFLQLQNLCVSIGLEEPLVGKVERILGILAETIS